MTRQIRPPRPLWSSSREVRYDVARRERDANVLVRYSAHRNANDLEEVRGVLVSVAHALTGAQGMGDFIVVRPFPVAGQQYRDVAISLATVHNITPHDPYATEEQTA
jgi:hypothetical protein